MRRGMKPRPEQLIVSDSVVTSRPKCDPAQTSEPTSGGKKDSIYMQIMPSAELFPVLFVPCGENG